MLGRLDGTRRLLAGLTLAVIGIASGSAAAQTALPEEYAARSIQRIALLDLRARTAPTADDYLVAERVLGSAMALRPDDPELVRAGIQAAWNAGDTERVNELTRELLRLDPADTVAQLRLVSGRINGMQTVEQRLAAYERLLGPGGQRIDPAVRSRLALDAAMLQRERGNFTAFAERLAQAMQLDASNKEAAALAWSALGTLVETRAERVELLLNLLMADPTDPNVHRQLALELALAGAFRPAQRFHNIALRLYGQEGAPSGDGLVVEAMMIGWQVDGPETVVESLNQRLDIQRSNAAAEIRNYEQARIPTDTLPRPEDVMLPSQYNHIRLVAALMIEDEETVNATLYDLTKQFTTLVDEANEAASLSSPEERARRLASLWGELTQHLVAVAWAGKQTEALRDWATQATDLVGQESPASILLRAWTELRFGDPAAAVELFEQIKDVTPLNRVGLGLALEAAGRPDDANAEYMYLASERPLSLSGVWARDRYQKATGIDPLASPERAEILRVTSQVPLWVDRMTVDARSFMQMETELLASSLGATGRAEIRIRLTNIAPIPLGVGGDRPINSRLLLAPRLQIGLDDEFNSALPEVLELNNRLRLMPTESLEVTVQPDAGVLGWIAEAGALDPVRQRWRVLQGYKLDAGGVPRADTLCLASETERLNRAPLVYGRVSAIELADALDTATEADLPEVLAAVRARALLDPGADHALTVDDRARIASIGAERYPRLSRTGRALCLAVLPTASMAPGMEAFDAAALAEEDPVLVPVALVTRVTDADDPVLEGWLESQADGLGAFARAMHARLMTEEPTFSRLPASWLRPRGNRQP